MVRHKLFIGAFCALVDLVATIAGAETSSEEGGIVRALELPGHEALIKSIARSDSGPASFESDGCSGGLSEMWSIMSREFPEFGATHQETPPWEACCVVHDRSYHNAAEAQTASESYKARLLADAALQACVVESGESRKVAMAEYYDVAEETVLRAYTAIAGAMHFAVRVGGAPCSGLSWRWGFGYPDCSVIAGEPE